MRLNIPAELWTYHTQFGVPLGIVPGWWDDRIRNHKPVLPLYLRLDISNNLSRALSCLRLSGHKILVQRRRHNRNRRPYELRIFDICDWHTFQDGEHILLDLPRERLVSLCTQHHQLVFPPQYEDSPTHLRTFLNQPDVWCGLFCGWVPSPFPLIFLAPFWFGCRHFPNFRSDAPQRHIQRCNLTL